MVYPKKVFFNEYCFLVGEHVYEPAEDSYLIANKMLVTEDDVVLDMGTSCGILAILAAKKAKNVVAVDINPYSINFAIRNAQTSCLEKKIEFRLGDLFNPIKKNERFSLIIFNSPYLPSEIDEEKSWIGKAWAGGVDGRQVIDRFIANATRFLNADGRVLLVQSSLSNINRTFEMFNEMNLWPRIVAKIKFPFEIIVLIEARRVS